MPIIDIFSKEWKIFDVISVSVAPNYLRICLKKNLINTLKSVIIILWQLYIYIYIYIYIGLKWYNEKNLTNSFMLDIYQDNSISRNKSGLKWYNEKNPINDTCNHLSILVKQKYSNSYILFLFSFRHMYTFTLYIVKFCKLLSVQTFTENQ